VPHRALFVDRPSLLLTETVERGMPSVGVNTRALDALCRIDPKLFRLMLVGNEEALAFERVPEARHARACTQIANALRRAHIPITADYTCAFSLAAPLARRKDSVFRLPNVGALKAARLEYDVELSTSWIVSDRAEAMLAGARAGVRTALVRSPRNERRYDITPDLVADDLGSAIRFLHKLQAVLSR